MTNDSVHPNDAPATALPPGDNLITALQAQARANPHAVAIEIQGRSRHDVRQFTRQQLVRLYQRFAQQLLRVSAPGERALIAGTTEIEFLIAYLGCLAAGITAVPIAPLRRARHLHTLERVARDVQPAVLITTSGLPDAAWLAQLQRQHPGLVHLDLDGQHADPAPITDSLPQPDNPLAFLQYSSGSTAAPKGVLVSHRNLLQNLTRIISRYELTASDRCVSWLPAFHDMGLTGGLLVPLLLGAPCRIMTPASFLSNPLRWLQAVADSRATLTAAPNFAFDLCVDRIGPDATAGLDLSALRCAWIGAEPVRQATIDRFARVFAATGFRPEAFKPSYGLAEAVLFVSGATAYQPRQSAATPTDANGLPLVAHGPADQGIVIVDPLSGEPVGAEHAEGEIWVAAELAASGYWGQPQASAAVFNARLSRSPEQGYLRTGDTGLICRGQLYVTGRLSDLIIARGRNHHPQDLEHSAAAVCAALSSTGIAAFAWPPPDGATVGLVCELGRSAMRQLDPRDLARQISQAITRNHELQVARIAFVKQGSLPRTSSGKPRRRIAAQAMVEQTLAPWFVWPEQRPAAAASAEALTTEAPTTPPQHELMSFVLATIGEHLREFDGELTAATPINTLGLDSLHAANLKFVLEQKTGHAIPVEMFFDDSTIGQLCASAGTPAVATMPPTQAAAPVNSPAAQATTSVTSPDSVTAATPARTPDLQFSLMYFSSDADSASADRYQLVLDGARFADTHDFHAVWLPERHFHAFGGLYPSPAVLAAALAPITSRVRLRAGSVVLPMHHPMTVAEQWSMVDNLSGGRVDLALAAGWNPNDFVLAPAQFAPRNELLREGIEQLRALWHGDSISARNGHGVGHKVRLYPRPVQAELPLWLTCSGSIERFEQAGASGVNVLTALLFQHTDELAQKIRAYRAARERHGFDPATGIVTLMMHTYLGSSDEQVRATVRTPFTAYLESSVDLWAQGDTRLAELTAPEKEQVLAYAFERYYRRSALFGTPEQCLPRVAELQAAGINEIASLIDFGIAHQQALAGLDQLHRLKTLVGAADTTPQRTDQASRPAAVAGTPPEAHQHAQTSTWPRPASPRPVSVRSRPEHSPATDPNHAGAVLLTGATGFLGAHVLAELLAEPERRVYCLVRARDNNQAAARIRAALLVHECWQPGFADRITAIAGDLTQPAFGLSEPDYRALQQSVHRIIHAAAQMNLLATYDTLAPVNVGGTARLLRFAEQAPDCAMHFVSSSAVFRTGYEHHETVSESNRPHGGPHWPAALARTKWEAELLVWQAADNGLAVNVFRPAPMLPSPPRAHAPGSGYQQRFIACCVALGALPATDDSFPVCPVDHVAGAIVRLGDEPFLTGQAFHLLDPAPLAMTDLPAILNAAGFPVTLLPAPQWRARLADVAESGIGSAAEAARVLLMIQSQRHATESGRLLNGGLPRLNDARTRAQLTHLGVHYHCDRRALIAQCIAALRSTTAHAPETLSSDTEN